MGAMASDPGPRAREFQDALYESLAGGSTGVRDADPLLLLERLTDAAMALAGENNTAIDTLSRLRGVAAAGEVGAALAAAADRFETPARFREAVYFGRCLARERSAALDLLAGQRYLQDVAVPLAFPDLLTDHDAVLDATTFALLWREPARAAWMLNALEIWKREYAAIYGGQHSDYRTGLTTIAERIDGSATKAAAVERLNQLRRLGPPVAVPALTQLADLERLYPCAIAAAVLNEALSRSPTCPECGYELGRQAPVADARRVVQAVERGLASQQARLARRVVSRIISRPGGDEDEKIERFIRVVQASDLTGLALVLDDELVEFLRDLLEGPPAADGVLWVLARAYPEVTPANLDAAVTEFRRLLEAGLAGTDGAVRLSDAPR